MKKLIATFIGIALVLAFTPVPGAISQSIEVEGPPFGSVKFVTDYIGDDTAAAGLEAPALYLKYIGSEESGTVDGITNGFELFSGPLGSEVINGSSGFDVNTGDVCGTTNDTLLYNDTECDTPAELCNVINDSAAPWVCALGNVLGADSLGTDADYIDPADAQAKRPGGFPVVVDHSAADTLAVLVRPDIGSGRALDNVDTVDRKDIEFFLGDATGPIVYTQDLKDNPFGGQQVVVDYVFANINSTSAWTTEVYCVRYKRNGRRDDRLVYSNTASTDATDLSLTAFNNAPIVCGPGETALIMATDDALVTGNLSYLARFFPASR